MDPYSPPLVPQEPAARRDGPVPSLRTVASLRPLPSLRTVARHVPVVVQAVVALAGTAGMIAAPPATGKMLLVPLFGADRGAVVRAATGAGAALVDAGPWHDSVIVSGDRSALIGAMMQGRMIVLRATAGGCGGKGQAL